MKASTWLTRGTLLTVLATLPVVVGSAGGEETVSSAGPLRDVAAFDGIADPEARAKALFVEAGRVIQHPRCLNCHPSDEHPRQGERLALHEPPLVRGDGGHGVAPVRCDTCHQARNVESAGVPGNPVWHLAPIEMGWIGVSLNGICRQLKDPARNGGRDLEAIHEHMAHDALVGWAWSPGDGREPAPGTQAAFGALILAWIDGGAHCPDGEAGATTVDAATEGAACDTCHARSAAAVR